MVPKQAEEGVLLSELFLDVIYEPQEAAPSLRGRALAGRPEAGEDAAELAEAEAAAGRRPLAGVSPGVRGTGRRGSPND